MGFIPPHGAHEKLACYQKTLVIYQGTLRFCERFMDKKDRTYDQMVQAARSGKQNIVEACDISGASKESEIKLLGFAKGSLQELREDYEDRLRSYKKPQWNKDSREAKYARAMARNKDGTSAPYSKYEPFIESRTADVIANLMICVIHQAHYLLDRLIARLEKDFLANGGLRERMTQARLAERARNKRPNA